MAPSQHRVLGCADMWLCSLPKTRLLGTLAVSRGLGDHQLKVIDTDIEVKPFLSCIPQVSDQRAVRTVVVNIRV